MNSGYQSLSQSFEVENVSVKGAVPRWLNGNLLRNGPAKFEIGEKKYQHWFDGLSLLHNFSINNGKISYQNRFLNSEEFKVNTKNNQISYRSFATDPCGGIFKRVFSGWYRRLSDNANVNIMKMGNHFLALTETPMAIEFDVNNLETIGQFNYDDDLKYSTMTAHPHYDSETQTSYNLVSRYGIRNKCYFYKLVENSLTRIPFAEDIVSNPSYQHSFAMTEHYIIRTDIPFFVTNSLKLLFGKPFIENFQWDEKRETIFSVFDKSTGKLIAKHKVPAFFTFHHVNAFEKNNQIIIDIVTYKDASIIQSFYLDNLNDTSVQSPFPQTQLTRFSLPIQTGVIKSELLYQNVELPRINYKFNMKDYSAMYAVGVSSEKIFDHLVKVDLKNKDHKIWKKENCFPGEPVFVPNPQQNSEDDGIILSVVLNLQAQQSFLLILDAKSFKELAVATLPTPLPFGLHGIFVA